MGQLKAVRESLARPGEVVEGKATDEEEVAQIHKEGHRRARSFKKMFPSNPEAEAPEDTSWWLERAQAAFENLEWMDSSVHPFIQKTGKLVEYRLCWLTCLRHAYDRGAKIECKYTQRRGRAR